MNESLEEDYKRLKQKYDRLLGWFLVLCGAVSGTLFGILLKVLINHN